MPIRITVTDVARNFSDYINRVLFRRERFVLLRGKRPVAELRPVNIGVPLADLPALFASFPHLDPDDAAAFEADLETGRAVLDTLPIHDPWQR